MINIYFFNSLKLKKERFEPHDSNHVKMYACGPTVYKAPHIGNFRSFIVFDVLFRLLSDQYPKVSYVRNVTDIDDKIIQESALRSINYSDLTKEVYAEYKKDSELLNVLQPTFEPFATEYMDKIILDIESLVKNGFAYVKEKHVFFQTNKYENYRDFCKNMKSEAGSRVVVNEIKKNDDDFVLWKPSDDVFWESPWGNGRPGWHIECTSMSKSILSFPFDIHCGGQDLIFPHHTNERAQGWGLCQKECSKYWLHNHFVNIDNDKMSKSLGNQLELKSILKKYNPMVIRLFLLMSHYRHPLNWTLTGLKEAENIYNKWNRSLYGIEATKALSSVKEAISDDLNTPLAIRKISEAIKNGSDLGEIAKSCNLLGIKFEPNDNDSQIQGLINLREIARKEKNYKESDKIRNQLMEMNIIIEDSVDGVKWYKK